MPATGAIVIGAGQAGLATSRELAVRDIPHVVLERGLIGQSWRDRWDSFCLVTPNKSLTLPGHPYDGDDPDGFMPRDEIVAYLERYAEAVGAPVKTGVNITSVQRDEGGTFRVTSDGGTWTAPHLVVSTGAYQKPMIPRGAETLPASVRVMDVGGYTNPGALPAGDVLIVGSGQTGGQIAEELNRAGRRVILACGRAPWFYRRVDGRDLFDWLIDTGFMDAPANDLPDEARLFANVLASGHDGGHDLTLRTLQAQGVELVGRFLGAEGGTLRFADDLSESVSWGDERFGQIRDLFKGHAAKTGMSEPDIPEPSPFHHDAPTEIDLAGFGTVLFTGGFRPDYLSWLPWPEAFDAGGFPLQRDGDSTAVPGLHFVGVHFLRTRKSALLCGVGEDAAVVAGSVAGT